MPWAEVTEQQLSRLAISGCQLSADVRIFTARLWQEPEANHPYCQVTFGFWDGKTSKQPQSLCLCASSAMGRWGRRTAFQARPFWLPAICRP